MKWLRERDKQPWPIAIAAGLLIAVIALAGAVGLMQNLYVKEVTEEKFEHAAQLDNHASDLKVAILQVRGHQRDLTTMGPAPNVLADFDESYAHLQRQIDDLDRLNIGDPEAPQPEQLREMARSYYEDFLPAVDYYSRDRAAFTSASERAFSSLDDLENASDAIDEVGKQSTEAALVSMKRAEDVERLVLLSVTGGLILALVALAYSAVRMVRMVGELRHLYAREQSASEALEQASRAKTELIADVSHELRTPLTVLRGNAEFGLAVDRDGAHREILEEIVGESARMSRMVEDLLFLARSDSTSLPLEREIVSAPLFMADLAGRAEVLAREKGARFKAELSGKGRLQIDSARIEQAVLILIDNAAKYGHSGGLVTLASEVKEDSLCISVKDGGPGISDEDLPYIFERFYRADKSRSRKEGGAGLGLSIARTIAELHGGSIEAASAVGKGTKITLCIPMLSAARRSESSSLQKKIS